ncbi:hypothetical protein pb186bvf_013175 [Paramecium bursaria]
MDEEQLMTMIQDYMKKHGKSDIKLGNIQITAEPQPRQQAQRVNTAVVVPNQYSTELRDQSKSQQKIDFQTSQESIQENKILEAPPNDFVQNFFGNINDQFSLDQFIDTPVIEDQLSNKSVTIQSRINKSHHVPKQLFQKVYQVLDKFQNDAIKNEIENALHDDFEQILKPHISISESSNTRFSFDTLTTLTDTTTSDPLRNFLMSLLPEQQQIQRNISQIEFLYLYSQPLVQSMPNYLKKPIQILEIQKEQSSIVDVFKSTDTFFRFMAQPARVDLFGESLDLNPAALHYTGHGIYQENTQQSFLLFEQLNGQAQLISAQQISLCLQKLKRPILFVFVASCHSKLIGEVFYQAGADHVICVHTKEKIMDDACRVFARSFYHTLLVGQMTVCEAFKSAKNQVKLENRFPCSEENKFLLLKRENQHNCQQWRLQKGLFQDLTKQSQYQYTLPQGTPHFIGRQVVMQDILEKILMHKFVTIKGVLGIGKSALARELSIYISERLIFKDGIIYLQLQQFDSFDSISSRLFQIMNPNKPLQSKAEMKQLIVTQLIQSMKNEDMLLILDNCDLILHSSDKEAFVDFLEFILSNCKCHILITNRNEVINNGKIIKIDGLLPEDSAQLLVNAASREIMLSEVEELLNHNDLSKFTWNDKIVIQRLAAHPLFMILDGHPQGIILAAGLLESYSLKELYNQLSYKQHLELPILGRMTEEEKRSLKVSLELSWENLLERYEKAAVFFSMLGLLPCGVFQEDLDWIYGSNWDKLANQLVKSSLLMCTKRYNRVHYCLYGFIVKFAESKLDKKQAKIYQYNIIQFYQKKIQYYYGVIGTQIGDTQHIEEFASIEQNIKSAIFREFEEISHGDWVYDSNSVQVTLQTRKRKNSDDIKKKAKKAVFVESDSDNFDLPLTKENLEMMQKRYEQSQVASSKTNSKIITGSVKFDQSSDEIGKSIRTEGPKQRKSLTNQQFTHYTISEEAEQSNNNLSDDSGMDINFAQSKIIQIKEPSEIINPQDGDVQLMKSEQIQPNISSQKPNYKSYQIEQKQQKQLQLNDEQKQQKKQIFKKTGAIRAKSNKQKEDNQQQKQIKKNNDDIKRERVQKLILYYSQMLLLLRKYNECLKIIQWAYDYYTDQLFLGNIIKTAGCAYYMQKEVSKAKEAFKQAKEYFIKRGCSLGVASCEAALGYINLQDRELQLAKVNFENALLLYENLNHDFGKHFLNRWLSLVKNKISSLKNDRFKHIKEEKQIIEQMKLELKKGIKIDNLIQKKHKGGTFVLRWLGDTVSIFMEIALVEDSRKFELLVSLKNYQPGLNSQKRSGLDTEKVENALIKLKQEIQVQDKEKIAKQPRSKVGIIKNINQEQVHQPPQQSSRAKVQIKDYYEDKKQMKTEQDEEQTKKPQKQVPQKPTSLHGKKQQMMPCNKK